ncbi:hypothetical protein J0H58_33120 [bacterium]|nr:hypothetical protein [bacterium]
MSTTGQPAPPAPAPPSQKPFHPSISPAHGQKITALIANRKLPADDKPRAEAAQQRYLAWVKAMDELKLEGDALLEKLVVAHWWGCR